jgi:hypothetical protein
MILTSVPWNAVKLVSIDGLEIKVTTLMGKRFFTSHLKRSWRKTSPNGLPLGSSSTNPYWTFLLLLLAERHEKVGICNSRTLAKPGG